MFAGVRERCRFLLMCFWDETKGKNGVRECKKAHKKERKIAENMICLISLLLQGDYMVTRGLTDCLPAEAIRHRTLGTGAQVWRLSGKRERCAILVPQLNAAKLQRITRQKHLATCNAKQASIEHSSQSDLNNFWTADVSWCKQPRGQIMHTTSTAPVMGL